MTAGDDEAPFEYSTPAAACSSSCGVAPAPESEYLVGDWNGDGRANVAVRRHSCDPGGTDNCVQMDFNFYEPNENNNVSWLR